MHQVGAFVLSCRERGAREVCWGEGMTWPCWLFKQTIAMASGQVGKWLEGVTGLCGGDGWHVCSETGWGTLRLLDSGKWLDTLIGSYGDHDGNHRIARVRRSVLWANPWLEKSSGHPQGLPLPPWLLRAAVHAGQWLYHRPRATRAG
jgi:hypothetical protein